MESYKEVRGRVEEVTKEFTKEVAGQVSRVRGKVRKAVTGDANKAVRTHLKGKISDSAYVELK